MRLIDADHYSKRLVQASKYWNTSKADKHDRGVAQGLLEADEKIADEEVIQAIPLEKVKQAREEMTLLYNKAVNYHADESYITAMKSIRGMLQLVDKLIESEGK